MRFTFTPEQEAFRQEVRAFLREALPPDWDGGIGTDEEEGFVGSREFMKKLAKRGWIAPAWPREYGGAGMTIWEQAIYNEEMAYHRAPLTNLAAVGYLGPTLIMYGTEEQKREHLPGITSGEVVWCQGYSEPNAGSDLASLQTRAVIDGDDFVINGQKIWTSQAHYADWMFLLARTDPDAPKHRGISFLLVDMKSPGITIRPLINMANQKGFNEVFFENVRTPRRNLVGELNRGWYVGTTTLDFERSSLAGSAGNRRTLEELTDYVRETKLGKNPVVRHRLADLWVEIETSRMLSFRVLSMQERGLVPNYEASIVKTFNSEYTQRLARTGLNLLGLYGQLHPRSPYAKLRGRFERQYLISVGSTIAGGTSEIQRNIIATRGLGLPRV
ncbi:MAG TPA: acyl-CoA dehydrogenase family protein [Dehalococcoidia bacterium]|nr:acyl-CoA dehydrogenase family protein [Dehalococcoidia bacterium]